MKYFFSIFISLFIGFYCFSQEKFLEVTITPKFFNGKKVKNSLISVSTFEGAIFDINAKGKKTTFYLPVGENFTISVQKEDYHPTFYTVDLRNIPENFKKDNKQKLELIPYLHSQASERPIPVINYKFDEKRGKVVKE